MMEREWAGILTRYGQTVTVRANGQTAGTLTKAFLQPILDKGMEHIPSPLGLREEEQILYLGAPEVSLTAGQSLVEWQGRTYEVQSAREIFAAGVPSHWWAVLRPADEEAPV